MSPALRIVVAMSGGVDSSLAAALLAQEGHQLMGATLRIQPDDPRSTDASCCAKDAIQQARAVADGLGIPHVVLDGRAFFDHQVLRPAWEEYRRGRTPSPCLHCNREIKFGLLLAYARRLGADRIASGHYARIQHDAANVKLLRGVDRHKDQSYFLSALAADTLRHLLLPLGQYSKAQVRAMAHKLGLSSAQRQDSQDACLIYENLSFPETLRQHYADQPRTGHFVDTTGKILGPHLGLHHYTIGQRRGLGIALGQPAHVVQLDAIHGDVVLSTKPADLLAAGLKASQVHWHTEPPPRCAVQIRSRHSPALSTLTHVGANTVQVHFDTPQSAVTPGQAVAFYDGDQVLGGGWIDAALP